MLLFVEIDLKKMQKQVDQLSYQEEALYGYVQG